MLFGGVCRCGDCCAVFVARVIRGSCALLGVLVAGWLLLVVAVMFAVAC